MPLVPRGAFDALWKASWCVWCYLESIVVHLVLIWKAPWCFSCEQECTAHDIHCFLKSEVKIAIWTNNQWKRNAFVMHFDHSCSSFMSQAMTIVNFIWLPYERKCPLPAVNIFANATTTREHYFKTFSFSLQIGRRDYENKTWEFTFPNFRVFPYARYRFSLGVLSKTKEVLGVIVADVNAVPKF